MVHGVVSSSGRMASYQPEANDVHHRMPVLATNECGTNSIKEVYLNMEPCSLRASYACHKAFQEGLYKPELRSRKSSSRSRFKVVEGIVRDVSAAPNESCISTLSSST